jgi:hypothetical protein
MVVHVEILYILRGSFEGNTSGFSCPEKCKETTTAGKTAEIYSDYLPDTHRPLPLPEYEGWKLYYVRSV